MKNRPIQPTAQTTLREAEDVAVAGVDVAEEAGHVAVRTEAATTENVSTMTGTETAVKNRNCNITNLPVHSTVEDLNTTMAVTITRINITGAEVETTVKDTHEAEVETTVAAMTTATSTATTKTEKFLPIIQIADREEEEEVVVVELEEIKIIIW